MSKTKRIKLKPTKERLLAFSNEHLFYEVSMLYGTAEALRIGLENQFQVNVYLESFVIHANIVLDFLFDIWQKEDDAIASDYIDKDKDWKAMMPDSESYFQEIRDRRHKEVAHLSYKRLDVRIEEKGWKFLQITAQIKSMVNKFLDEADSEVLHSRMYELRSTVKKTS